MIDPALAIQGAVIAALKADAGVASLIAGRIHDTPPENPTYPYVTLGPDQVIGERADCYAGSEVFIQLDVWSRSVGYVEAKRIAAAIRECLHEADLVLDGHRLIDMEFESSRFLREGGLASHGALTLKALTEPTT